MAEAAAPAAAPQAQPAAPAQPPAPAPQGVVAQANQSFAEKMKAGKQAKAAKLAAAAGAPAAQLEKPEAERPKLDQLDADALFTPEALSTPEGIARAKEIIAFAKGELENRHRRFDRGDLKLKAREKELTTKRADLEQREQRMAQLGRSIQQDFNTIKGLRQAAPMEILQALDRLAGGNGSWEAGQEIFLEMSKAYARDGKAPTKSREVAMLEQQMEALKREREEERKKLTEREKHQQVEQTRIEVAQGEAFLGKQANDATKYPNLARWILEGRSTQQQVGKYVADLMEEAFSSDEPLDAAAAIGILESRLAPFGGERAPQGESGSGEPEPVAEKKQPAAKRAATVSTVLPSDADRSSGTTRKESPEERRRRMANDGAMMKKLGLARFAG